MPESATHIEMPATVIMLEVMQKPGNVSFVSSFEETRVEHFLASAVAAAPSFQDAAYRGIMVAERRLGISKIGLGELIKDCIMNVAAWQQGGNTILGTVMLFMPIAVAAGMTPMQEDELNFSVLRRNIDAAVRSTSAWDSVHLYEAIDIASPSGLGGAPDLDATDPSTKGRLLKDNVSLFEVFKVASTYDDIYEGSTTIQ